MNDQKYNNGIDAITNEQSGVYYLRSNSSGVCVGFLNYLERKKNIMH